MDVIVHYPTDKQNLELLHKQVAIEHAKFVVDYISKLNCSENKKLELLKKNQYPIKQKRFGSLLKPFLFYFFNYYLNIFLLLQ